MEITTEIAKIILKKSVDNWVKNDELQIPFFKNTKFAYPYRKALLSFKLRNKKWLSIKLQVIDVIFSCKVNIEMYEKDNFANKCFFESNFFEDAICDDFQYFINKAFYLPNGQVYHADVFERENSNKFTSDQKNNVCKSITKLLCEYIDNDSISSRELEQYHINLFNGFEVQK